MRMRNLNGKMCFVITVVLSTFPCVSVRWRERIVNEIESSAVGKEARQAWITQPRLWLRNKWIRCRLHRRRISRWCLPSSSSSHRELTVRTSLRSSNLPRPQDRLSQDSDTIQRISSSLWSMKPISLEFNQIIKFYRSFNSRSPNTFRMKSQSMFHIPSR